MKPEQAKLKISWLVKKLQPELDEFLLGFYVEKITADILSYCHIEEFPEALIYDAAEIISKTVQELTTETETAATPYLKKIKQDDSELEYFETDYAALTSNKMLDALKPKLNLFRRLISW